MVLKKHQSFENFIEICSNEESTFFNTITGQIGHLELVSTINEKGKLAVHQMLDVSHLLRIEKKEENLVKRKKTIVFSFRKRGKKCFVFVKEFLWKRKKNSLILRIF